MQGIAPTEWWLPMRAHNIAARDGSVEANYGIIFLCKLLFIPEWKGMNSKKDQRQEYSFYSFY
jgi:hypothetical protein